MVKRYENWPLRLSEFLNETKRKPFQWGQNDCLTFAAKAVETITGERFLDHIPAYNDEEGAQKVLDKYGGVLGTINYFLGESTTQVLSAQRGDIALVKTPEFTAGVVDDTGRYVLVVSKEGLKKIPLERAKKVWRV